MARENITRSMLALALALACTAVAQDSPFPPASELADKPAASIALKAGQYAGRPAEWGLIVVPENRNRAGARLMRLPFVRVRAQEDARAAPLFLLNGGPGDSNVFGNDPAPIFSRYNDLVMVGYRGVDSSAQLKCPEVGKAMTVDNPLSPEGLEHIRETLRTANRALREAGVDLDGFTLLEVVDDLEAVRGALGYERVNLFSISYGTLLAHAYCRRYPASVRRSLMAGAGHIGRPLAWEPSVVHELLRRYGELWKQDPAATARTPDILQTMRRMLDTLPRQWERIRIDRDKVRIAAFHMLYETETAAMVFDAFVAAEEGDYSGLAMLSVGYDEGVAKEAYWCEFYSKAVSTGFDPPPDLEASAEPGGAVLGAPLTALVWGPVAGRGWPITPVPAEFRKPAITDVPTLVLMGSLDFAAPPRYARELMSYLPKGQLVLIEGVGHNEVVRGQREAFEHLMVRFLVEGAFDGSRFKPQAVSFRPKETLQEIARRTLTPPTTRTSQP